MLHGSCVLRIYRPVAVRLDKVERKRKEILPFLSLRDAEWRVCVGGRCGTSLWPKEGGMEGWSNTKARKQLCTCVCVLVRYRYEFTDVVGV